MMSDLGNKAIMAKNIRYYMDLNNKTRNDMCEALGVKYTTFTDWVKGNSYPRIDKIELMANYFGIEKSDLVEEYGPDQYKRRVEEREVLAYYNQLNKRGKNKVIEYASDLTHNSLYTSSADHLTVKAAHSDNADDPEEQKLIEEDLKDLERFKNRS